MDADKFPDITDKYGVRGLPTMILFKNGKPADTLIGYHPESEIQTFLTH